MKLKHTLSLLSLATCAALSTSAFAQNTVQFIGEITDSACGSVTVVGGSTVTLPQQSHTDFGPNVGDFAASQTFSVELDQCKPLPGTFALNFSNASVDTNLTAGYIEATGVTNVGYELTTTGGVHIPFTKTANNSDANIDPFDANTPTTGVVNTAGVHTLDYAVRYVRLSTAALGTGTTTATAMMTVQYM